MSEDTRKLILRIQSEDLADLWTASADDKSEIDATQRVYRRQLKLLGRHLEDTRQANSTGRTAEAARRDAVTVAPQTPDTDTPILTEDGGVHRVGFPFSGRETPLLFSTAASTPPSILATTVRSLPQVSDRPIVRLPLSASTTEDQVDKLMRDEREAAIRGKQAEEARREPQREEVVKMTMSASRTPARFPQQLQPAFPHAQSVQTMSIYDIFEVQDQKKVERMTFVVPGRAISVLYKALQDCHGNFDDAIDMILRQEADEGHMDGVDLTSSAIESHSAQYDAQPRAAAKQPTEGPTRATANKYLNKPKPTNIRISATGDRNSTLVSTKPSMTTATSLKRSADHFTPSDGPASKKHTSVTIKKESECGPELPAQKDTIGDRLENLLQSSRSLPSPIPRAGNPESRHVDGGMSRAPPPPPPDRYQRPDMRSNGQRSGPQLDLRASRAALSAPPPPPPPSGPRLPRGTTRVRRRR
jgi:hypothetical protein